MTLERFFFALARLCFSRICRSCGEYVNYLPGALCYIIRVATTRVYIMPDPESTISIAMNHTLFAGSIVRVTASPYPTIIWCTLFTFFFCTFAANHADSFVVSNIWLAISYGFNRPLDNWIRGILWNHEFVIDINLLMRNCLKKKMQMMLMLNLFFSLIIKFVENLAPARIRTDRIGLEPHLSTTLSDHGFLNFLPPKSSNASQNYLSVW